MALGTATKSGKMTQDSYKAHLLSHVGDDAYAAGGTADYTAFVRSAIGEGNLEVLGVFAQDCGDHVPVFDPANDKLKVYLRSTGAEATGDLSSVTYNYLVIYR
jgi:hypothetical protein